MIRKVLAAAAALGAGLAMSSPAIAHHSVSGIFQTERSTTLEGQLTNVEWVNPHIYFAVTVKEADGKLSKWRFETLPPGFMRRAGLTKELFMDDGGKPIKILFSPPRDPANKTGYALEITYADGHSYKLGAVRNPVPPPAAEGIDMTTAKFLASGAAAFAVLAFACAASAQGAKHPDLTGTFDNAGDLATAASAVIAKPGQSLCVFACPPAPSAQPVAAGARQVSRGFVLPPVERPKYKPEFLGKVKELSDRQVDEDTSLKCASPGVPRIGPPEKIVQNDREVVFLYEDISGPFFRVIPTDGRARRSNLDRSPLGDSIGRWEGDTLVVETTNFTEDTWLTDDGAFHTKDLRVVEKIRRVEGGGIEWQATSYDPAVLAEPWAKMARKLEPAKNEIVVSSQCREQSLVQMVDKSHHDNAR